MLFKVTPLAKAKESGLLDAATRKTLEAGKLHWAQRGRHVQPLSANCEYCQRARPYDSMVSLASCGHRNCRTCVHDAVVGALRCTCMCVCEDGVSLTLCVLGASLCRAHKPSDIACRVCGMVPSESEVNALLTPAEMELYHEAQLELFLAQDNRFVRCPNGECRCPMETSSLANSGRDWAINGGADAMGPDGKPLVSAPLVCFFQYCFCPCFYERLCIHTL